MRCFNQASRVAPLLVFLYLISKHVDNKCFMFINKKASDKVRPGRLMSKARECGVDGIICN